MTWSLMLRLILSLAVIIGGLLAVKWWGLRGNTRMRGIKVVARSPLGRNASVAVLDVAGRRYLIGAAEQSVNLIAELDPDVELGMVTSSPDSDPTSTEPVNSGPVGARSTSRPGVDGSSPGAFRQREMPRIGFLAQLRRYTTRVPQGVRIHGLDD